MESCYTDGGIVTGLYCKCSMTGIHKLKFNFLSKGCLNKLIVLGFSNNRGIHSSIVAVRNVPIHNQQ